MSTLFNDTATVTLSRITCCSCGMVFAVDSGWGSQRRNDHAWFYCPNGHSQHFTAKSAEERVRAELEIERQSKQYWITRHNATEADLRSERHKVAAERGAKTKLRNKLSRVHNGVCPECNRSFPNLKEHMTAKHEKSLTRHLSENAPKEHLVSRVSKKVE